METITIDNITMNKATAKAAPEMLEALRDWSMAENTGVGLDMEKAKRVRDLAIQAATGES